MVTLGIFDPRHFKNIMNHVMCFHVLSFNHVLSFKDLPNIVTRMNISFIFFFNTLVNVYGILGHMDDIVPSM